MKKKKVFLLLIFALAVLVSFYPSISLAAQSEKQIGAEELLFQEIPMVTAMGFFEMSTLRSPGASTIITRKDINDSPGRTLEDLINYYVPGMNTGKHERQGVIIGVRGLFIDNNAKTLVMLDQQNINQRSHFGYMLPLSLPLIGDLESLEVVNGPCAIVHGSGAISGFINMIPKSGSEYSGFSANTEYGDVEGLKKQEVGYGMSYGESKDLYLYGGVVSARGVIPHKSWGASSIQLGNMRVSGFPDPSYRLAAYWNHGDFNLNTFFQETNIQIPGIDSHRYSGDPDSHAHHAILGVRPKYLMKLNGKETLDIIGSVEVTEHADRPEPTLGYKSEGASECHGQIEMIGKTTRFKGHSLAAGFLVGRRNFKERDQYFHADSVTNHEGMTTAWREFSFFSEDIIEFSPRWIFSAGGRYDKTYYSPMKNAQEYEPPDTDNTSWRFSTSYEFNPETTTSLSYQQAFRFPDAVYWRWVSYFSDALTSLGYSPLSALKPEKMESTEFNLRRQIKDLNLKLNLNLYYNNYYNTLHWYWYTDGDLEPGAVTAVKAQEGWMGAFANVRGGFKSTGLELTGRWEPVSDTTLMLSYGLSRPLDVDDKVYQDLAGTTVNKSEWTQYPRHLIKGAISSKLLKKKLLLTLSLIFNPAYPVDKSAGFIPAPYSHSRTVVDFGTRYSLTKDFALRLTIKNLFKNTVPPMVYSSGNDPAHGAIGTDRRYIYFSAEWKW